MGFWSVPSLIGSLQGRKKVLETFCLRERKFFETVRGVESTKGGLSGNQR